MITPRDFLALVIARWEGGYENDPSDAGNWVTTPDGRRIDLGTMRGVTPATLAYFRGIDPATLTVADMASVTLDQAADIGMELFYQAAGFDKLTWGPATAALVDFAWGSGPAQAARSMQPVVGVEADGDIGPITAAAYNAWLIRLGPERSTLTIHEVRAAFYRGLVTSHPGDAGFLQGWLNRDDWASASNAEFWAAFTT